MLHRLTHIVSCREASRLLSRREEQPLASVERFKLALHLRLCRACTRFARQLVFIRRAMVRYRS
jgi:hypothetical protein